MRTGRTRQTASKVRSTTGGIPTGSTKAMAHFTGRKSTSISATPSGAPGNAERSSSTCRCPRSSILEYVDSDGTHKTPRDAASSSLRFHRAILWDFGRTFLRKIPALAQPLSNLHPQRRRPPRRLRPSARQKILARGLFRATSTIRMNRSARKSAARRCSKQTTC